MRGFRRTIHLYKKYIAVIIRSTMQYKTSLLLMIIGRFILAFNGLIGISFLFSGFTRIKQYSYSDDLLCFAIVQLSFSLSECVASGFNVFSRYVKQGEFDRMLLRTCGLFVQILGTRFEIGRIGPLITAIITLFIGIDKSQLQWDIGRVFTLILMVLGGMLLFVAINLLGASLCFFTIDDGRVINVLTYGARDHGKYPMDIYGRGIKRFGTFIISYALFQYYPLQYLLGKSDAWYYALYPFGILIFFGLCYGVWLLGLRYYKSCGN